MLDFQVVLSRQVLAPSDVTVIPPALLLLKSSSGQITNGVLTDTRVSNFLSFETPPAQGDVVLFLSGPQSGKEFIITVAQATQLVLDGFPTDTSGLIYRVVRPGAVGAALVLDIRGANFNKVTEVRVNDLTSPDVMIVSQRQLLAEVPSQITSVATIRTIELLTNLPATTEPAKLFFELSRTPVPVSGIQKLVQLVVKLLLTTPGRDIFEPGDGGGFLRHVGTVIRGNDISSLMTDLTVGLTQAQTQIIERQSQDTSIPDDERLLSLDVVDALFDPQSASIFVAIRVRAVAGSAAISRLFI